MASINVHNEEPFKVAARTFTIDPTESGFTMQHVAVRKFSDGGEETTDWSDADTATDANVTDQWTDNNPSQWLRLKDHSGDVTIVF